ncbi:hypothetical protein Kpho02_18510 [Kitasatospora phosalacinea]|uniref:Uncharacterized protein n=1 Tax=Kitasatospora phosalacinea TaxID=2065 RepID=A0A9W6Q7J0_9ACTN|nr:hypothetical protein [Kitasatospora phosalacinea]GLW69552.1 hypothetical protein Kpho02_18510 [Kitasatospora phosalacinea]
MTVQTRLDLADRREGADLAAFLGRLLRFDRAAAVRLQAVPGPEGGVLAVFGRLPLGGAAVLAVRTVRLAGLDAAADLTVSAGQLLESVDEPGAALGLPAPVTGPSWAGLLPPRSGWQLLGRPPVDRVVDEVQGAVAEFKHRVAGMPDHHRTRQAVDAVADEIWSRPLAAVEGLPLRAAHAAHTIGFLRAGGPLAAYRAGAWLRLDAPAGSVALRTAAAPGAGLGLSPLR